MGEEEKVPFSGAWLRNQSDEQLQELIDGSLPGQTSERLMAELESRKEDRERARQLFWIKLTLLATVALGVASIAVALLKP